MTETQPSGSTEKAAGASGNAGDMLRAAREAAGLSIDALSQQLKLAPRQVKALEEGDFASLPGRTFVRGFVRNYARAVGLDPEVVVAAIPDAVEAPALDRSAIAHAHRPIGELPTSGRSRPGSWARWAIPIVLIAAIGAAALYEYLRPGDLRRSLDSTRSAPAGPAPSESAPVPSGIPLPNPVVQGAEAEPPPSDAPRTEPAPLPVAPSGAAPALAPAGPTPPGSASSPAMVAPLPAPAATATTPAASADATLVVSYRTAAWTEIRDRDGKVLLQRTGAPGTTQTVTGKPPFDLTLGNASENSVTWRGAPFDLTPHVRQGVARVRLP